MENLKKYSNQILWLVILIPFAFMVGCGSGTGSFSITEVSNNTPILSGAKAITAYSLAGVAGVINEPAKTISVTLPNGVNVTNQIATFMISGVSVDIGPTVQVSTATVNDFTNPVLYTVNAADGSMVTYTVLVAVAPSTAKAITSYSLAGAVGAINEAAKTITVTVPNGTSLTALAATFTTTGVSVKVGAIVQVSTITTNNFTNPVLYVVTDANGITVIYTVTVTIAPSSAKAITAYSFAGYPDSIGVINEIPTPKTIAVGVLPGTDKTSLVATFVTTGASVKVGATVQTSATTANNFTNPVSYTAIAVDGSSATYNVIVTTGQGPVPVPLGTANNFVILAETGVTDTPTSVITGNVGATPVTGAAIVGLTCAEVTGIIYSVDVAGPACRVTNPLLLSAARIDMESAYNNALARSANFVDVGGGTLANQTLVPGIYSWNSALSIPTNLTLSGGVNDVWIFQVNGALGIAASKNIILTGGAQAKNIFWQVVGGVTLNSGSHFEGIVLGGSSITMITGASINGRLLAWSAVTLDSNVIKPQ